jgi:hypothetical protein
VLLNIYIRWSEFPGAQIRKEAALFERERFLVVPISAIWSNSTQFLMPSRSWIELFESGEVKFMIYNILSVSGLVLSGRAENAPGLQATKAQRVFFSLVSFSPMCLTWRDGKKYLDPWGLSECNGRFATMALAGFLFSLPCSLLVARCSAHKLNSAAALERLHIATLSPRTFSQWTKYFFPQERILGSLSCALLDCVSPPGNVGPLINAEHKVNHIALFSQRSLHIPSKIHNPATAHF